MVVGGAGREAAVEGSCRTLRERDLWRLSASSGEGESEGGLDVGSWSRLPCEWLSWWDCCSRREGRGEGAGEGERLAVSRR